MAALPLETPDPADDPHFDPAAAGYTVEEYLALDARSQFKYEYLVSRVGSGLGRVVAMAGASYRHGRLVTSCLLALGDSLRSRGCDLIGNDLRVRTDPDGTYSYPDLVGYCGSPTLETIDGVETLVDPLFLIEVTSPSTESNDRGDKLRSYRRIPSLMEYVLVQQDRPIVEVYRRQTDAELDGPWLYQVYEGLEAVVELTSVEQELPLSVIYDGIDFEAKGLSEESSTNEADPERGSDETAEGDA